MNCGSLFTLTKACQREGVAGGIDLVYAMAFKDAYPNPDGRIYTMTDAGVVDSLNVSVLKSFVNIAALKNTAVLSETLTVSRERGTKYVTQTFSVSLESKGSITRNWTNNILQQPIIVIVKSRIGNYYAAGLNGDFELSELIGGSRALESDLDGYELTFNGIDIMLIPLVDPTLIAELITPQTPKGLNYFVNTLI